MKWGILGTSFISGVMADAIKGDAQSELYAVAGRTEKTLNEFAAQYQPTLTFNSYEALIEDESVDIIYIALPNHVHHEYVIKAAQKGKAILCEKSLSVDMEKTEQALQAVKEAGVFFAEGLMYLNHPLIAKLHQELATGEIGEVRSIQGSYVAAIDQFVNPASKGALYNLGCYPMSLIHSVAQHQFCESVFDDLQISAIGRRGQDGNICESSAMMRFNDHFTAQIHTAENHGLKHGFTILGSKGCITLDTNPWLPTEDNTFTVEIYETSTREVKVEAQGDGFHYQVRNIRQAVEQGETQLTAPMATHQDSRVIMKLLTDWEQAAS
ncbi:Gfo/Idh/MocA family protein [Vibrio pomeroyi]|uniref:Gfo/Idh/MocA family protein n=1 Tax=Vibrio pomeroyi TaxID=198832 RepID=UPI0021C41AFB|nr:Gfo/Idh/MocA family oxidoreductase [Vibrio pomeroyi]